jgi:preprotein translocase subunit YajC
MEKGRMLQTLILLADGEAPQGSGIIQFLPLIAIAAIFYLLMIRPMRKQEQERQGLARNLKKNDEILTTSGFYVTVVDVGEDNDDKITVRLGDARVKMTKASVFRNLTNEEAAKEAKAAKETKA